MVIELIPTKLAFRGLSDEPDADEEATVVDAPGDLDDDEEDEESETLGAPADDDQQDDGAAEQ